MPPIKHLFSAALLAAITLKAQAIGSLPNDRKQMEAEVHRLWETSNFSELNKLEILVRTSRPLTPSGWPLLALLYQAIQAETSEHSESKEQVDALVSRSEKWAKEAPDSQLAAFIKVNSILAAAWNARGSGYANTVSSAQWAKFRQHSQEAVEYLERNKRSLSSNPYWYSIMLLISQQTSAPESEYRMLLEEAWKRHPNEPYFYIDPINYYTPKWGGSTSAMANFITTSSSQLKGDAADQMYARQYSYAIENNLFPIATTAPYNCARWKKGWEKFSSKFPTNLNYNHSALASILCKDKESARKYFSKFGETSPDISIWERTFGTPDDFIKWRNWSQSSK